MYRRIVLCFILRGRFCFDKGTFYGPIPRRNQYLFCGFSYTWVKIIVFLCFMTAFPVNIRAFAALSVAFLLSGLQCPAAVSSCIIDVCEHDYAFSFAGERLEFSNYSSEAGLPPSMIEDICEDPASCLWLATWLGLYCFDGIGFTHFDVQTDVPAIYHDSFVSVAADVFANIWALGADGGLYQLNRGTSRLFRMGENSYKRLFKLDNGEIFFLSEKGELFAAGLSAGDGSLLKLPFPAGLEINDIFSDFRGNVWVLTDRSVLRNWSSVCDLPAYTHEFDGETILLGSDDGKILAMDGNEFDIIGTGIPGRLHLLASIPGSGKFLAGSVSSGLYEADLQKGSCKAVETGFAGDGYRALKNESGNLWIFSDHGGLAYYDKEKMALTPFFNDRSSQGWDQDNVATAAIVNSRGQLWFSGTYRSLDKAEFTKDAFAMVSLSENAGTSPANAVRSLLRDSGGLLYASTSDGRLHILDRKGKSFSVDVGANVRSLVQGKTGVLWAATSKGLLKINHDMAHPKDVRVTPYRYSPDFYAMVSDNVRSLCISDSGRLWIGLDGVGISFVDTDDPDMRFVSKRNLLLFPTEESNKVRHICFSPSGEELYGCGNLGLFVCRNPHANPADMVFDWMDVCKGMDVNHISFSSDGVMYVSTNGSGLMSIKTDDAGMSVKTYSINDGMLSDYVLASGEDANGNIWISTYVGLNKLNPQSGSLISYPRERIDGRLLFTHTDPVCGMDGLFFFGTNMGIIVFNANEVSNSNYNPKLTIQEAFIGTNPAKLRSGDKVSMGQNEKILLRFKAVDMTAPERVVYSYTLTKGEPDWVNLGTTGQFVIRSLSPGKYTLGIRSSNADGQIADNAFFIRIFVYPSPNAAVIVFLLFVLLVFAAVIFLMEVRKRALAGGYDEECPEKTEFVKAFDKYLLDNIDNGDLSIADMAEAMHVGRTALFNKCRKYTGGAPVERLLDMRLNKAAELLETTGDKISRIAFMSGFNDSQYFSRVFRNRFGMTPSDYRNGRKGV